MNIHLFSMFWGDHYVELFKKACFRSINWPKNLSAVSGSVWNVYTKREHFEELDSIFKNSEFKLQLWEIGESIRVAGCGFVRTSLVDAGVILLNGLREQIHWSIKNNSKMLFAPPDTLFGDGTIANLARIGVPLHSCVAFPHPRVHPGILDDVDELIATRGQITNSKLVTLAMKHAHKSWSFGEIGHESNNSFIGGISWKRLDDGLWAVSHKLPTCYLADFTHPDFDFFWSQVSFGGWDHRWPAENLIRQGRQRLVGSSDACFAVEITDWDKNVPPEMDRSKLPPGSLEDAYWNNHYHNGINNQSSVIWRGD
jgi:hypothetical protein